MNDIITVDTLKVKTDIIREMEDVKNNFSKVNSYIEKIYELQCTQIYSELELIRRNAESNELLFQEYIDKVNQIIKEFDDISSEIIKETTSIEKINASNIMSKKTVNLS